MRAGLAGHFWQLGLSAFAAFAFLIEAIMLKVRLTSFVFIVAFSGILGVAAQVRILDSAGAVSNAGLLEIRTGGEAVEFGTVCGMNLAAAEVVCKQLGYDFGSVSDSSCSDYGGSALCGAQGAPVAMEDLECTGGELDILSCSYKAPTEKCAGHKMDAIVYCGKSGAGLPEDGALRLLSGGAPSIDGVGRLELFTGGAWSSVCSSGFTPGSASVACKAMGFSGAKASTSDCAAVGCGSTPPQISEMSCSGGEADLLSCAFEEGDDVFCDTSEGVVISCVGDGDTQGRPMKIAAPQI